MRASAILVLLFLGLLTACPQSQDADNGARGSFPADAGLAGPADGEREDVIGQALISEFPDETQFAMLAITTFGLKGYEEQIRNLGGENIIAAVTLAAVYQDVDAAYEHFATQMPQQRIGGVLGAVYGLRCADRVPAGLWGRILDIAEEAELDELLWGLAQLDVEPGGPLKRSTSLNDKLLALREQALASGDTYRRGALDALLGDTGLEIDWQLYVDYVAQSHWNSVQWAALLRWAPEEAWRNILKNADAHEAIQLELGRALVLTGPATVGLPGSGALLITMGMEREYRAIQFIQGAVPTMELPELEVLLGESALLDSPESEDDRFRQQAYNLAISDVLVQLDYALIHDDSQLVQRIVDAMPNLSEVARNGIMATINRRNPSALNDEQLSQLIAMKDRAISYFLLQGWYDRPVVQESKTATLVLNTPSRENAIIVDAYWGWLAQQ